MPNSVLSEPESEEAAMTFVSPASPSAFTSREIGSALRLGMTDSSKESLRIKVDLTRSALLERISWGEGLAKVEMPKFLSHGVMDELTLRNGMPVFLGTMSPPKGDQKVADRRVFATAKVSGKKGK